MYKKTIYSFQVEYEKEGFVTRLIDEDDWKSLEYIKPKFKSQIQAVEEPFNRALFSKMLYKRFLKRS